ncbi:MAG: hypothetical protein U0521_01845 [Anaerolineae bacterium]
MRIFDPVDPAYAGSSCRRYLRTETAPAGTLGNYGQMSRVRCDVPAWIGEPDVTSIGLLALSAYYQARLNATTADILTKSPTASHSTISATTALIPGDMYLRVRTRWPKTVYLGRVHDARWSSSG